MSYNSRVYRQRNAHTHDEAQQETFFSKKHNQKMGNANSSFFQAKLSVNKPGDSYEKEADAVASKVVNHSGGGSVVQQKEIKGIQRLSTDKEDEKLSTNDERIKRDRDIQQKPMEENKKDPDKDKLKGIHKKEMKEEDKMKGVHKKEMKEEDKMINKNKVQRKSGDLAGGSTASAKVSQSIEHSGGKGSPLAKSTQREMGSSFGYDFSGVRIHNDSEAVRLNGSLQSQAFTHGADIYFNEGKYDPNSSSGKFLLAHELTHVIQQGMAGEDKIQKSPALVAGISALVLAAFGCCYYFFNYALNNFPDKTDKWKHCWVSCKIASYCGGDAIALLVGAGKEGLDAICDAYYGGGCKAEFMDFLADVVGVACSSVPLVTCSDCCDEGTATF